MLKKFRRRSAFSTVFLDNFQPELVNDVINGVTEEQVGVDVRVNFVDSKLNRSRDIRAAHFVMDDDERRRTL